MSLKALEFAEDDGRMHAVYCLRGEDVALYGDERRMGAGKSPDVDRFKVRFRILRAGRAGEDEGRWGKDGHEAVELLQ